MKASVRTAIARLQKQGWTIRPAGACILVAPPGYAITTGRYVSLISLHRETSDPYAYIVEAAQKLEVAS